MGLGPFLCFDKKKRTVWAYDVDRIISYLHHFEI